MSRQTQENLIAIILIGVLTAAIVAALDYGPRARLVPIPIAALGLFMAVGQLLLQNFRSEKDLRIDVLELVARRAADYKAGDDTASPDGESEIADDDDKSDTDGGMWLFHRELKAVGFIVFLVAIFMIFGPLTSVFIFTAGYFMLTQHHSPARSILFATGFSIAVYIVFTLWLGVDLLRGMIDMSFVQGFVDISFGAL